MKYLKNIYSKENELFKKVYKWFNLVREDYSYLVKPFIIFIIIYALAIYPIIRANYNYVDDIGRVFYGYRGWDDFSRFISCYLSIFIHSSRYLTDISPLPQLIAIVILAISSIIILHLFKKDKKISFLNIVTIIPLGLSPYFIECLSYKYDSPYMAISVLASIFPFLFYNKESKYNILFCIAVFLGVNAMCMTYQAASGILPLMTLFLAFKFWNGKDGSNSIKLIILSLISYLLGMAFFKIFIMIPVDTYVSSSILKFSNLIPGIYNNLHTYYSYVFSDFRVIELVLMGLLILCFIISQVINSKQNKFVSLVVSCVVICFSLLITFGLYPALDKPSFLPRAMYGFGALLAIVGFNATSSDKAYFSKIIAFCLCWCIFTFPFTYGNILSEEKKFIDFRIQSVINGLNEMDIMADDTHKTIKLVGVSAHTPVLDNMPKDYQKKLSRLVPSTFDGNWFWGTQLLANYYRLPNASIASYDSEIPNDLSLFKDTAYYKIETNNVDYILVTIK